MNNENTVDTVDTQTTQEGVQTETTTHEAPKKVSPAEVLREISKRFSVNLFEDGGLTALDEKIASRDNEVNTYKTRVDELTKREQTFAEKEREYQTRIEALSLGFKPDALDEVLALAKVAAKDQPIAEGLKLVREKYGNVFTVQTDIGIQQADRTGNKPDLPKNEQERYLAESRAVRQYQRTMKKIKS